MATCCIQIKAENLTKIFGNCVAVANFSCDIPEGKIIGILGANGAGKTTIMRMMTGYLCPTSGNIKIGGYDLLRDSCKARSLIGYLPENTPLYSDMKVKECLQYVALLKGVTKSSCNTQVTQSIELSGLNSVIDKKISRISRGYRQRTALAQALVSDPPILILDEPTSALDPIQIQETRTVLKTLGKSKTILISTHILPEVEQICDAVIILYKGHVVLQGEISTLLQNRLVLRIEFSPKIPSPISDIMNKIVSIEGVSRIERITDHELTIHIQKDFDPRENLWKMSCQYQWPIVKFFYASIKLEDVYACATKAEMVV